MSEGAFLHFLERAVDRHAARMDDAFPACFDWHALCRDAPAMTARASAEAGAEAGAGAIDEGDIETSEMLVAQADVAFRIAHIAALAVLCVAEDRRGDPDAELEAFGDGTEEEEEDAFAVLASEVLGPAEAFLHDAEVELVDRGVEVQRLLAICWPMAAEYLALTGLFGDVPESEVPPAPEAAFPILSAIGRLGALLAILRWMARYPDEDAVALD